MTDSEILWLDFETYSPVDLKSTGVYPYVAHPEFTPLLLSYAFGDGDFHVHDFTVDWKFPQRALDHILTGGTFASHGSFDYVILKHLYPRVKPEQHLNTMVLCAEYGIPQGLKFAGDFLGCQALKDPIGRLAILKFCKPNKVRGEGKVPRRVMPEEDQELWDQFVQYCRVDGILMREVFKRIPKLSVAEERLQNLDQVMNDRGIRLDLEACKVFIKLGDEIKERLNAIMVETTDNQIQTIGQVAKIAAFCDTTSAGEEALNAAMPHLTGAKQMVAQLRLAGAKSSTAKLPKMVSASGDDSRSRGCLQFHGTVTGRFSGRMWQPHNLPRESFKPAEVDLCIDAARGGYQSFVKQYPEPLKAISMCLRGMIVPAPGCELIIADYAQIEARVLAWYAQQDDIVELYASGGDVYKEMASSVFNKPTDQVTGSERFRAKTLVLGSGYGLGWAGLQRNLARFGVPVTDDEAKHYTRAFRQRFSKVVRFWAQVMDGVYNARTGTGLNRYGQYPLNHNLLNFGREGKAIYMQLPTGKRQWFHSPREVEKEMPWGDMAMVEQARDPRGSRYYDLTHSIMVENVCSATSREILVRAIYRLEQAGYNPILSVHDEIIMEVPIGFGSDQEVMDLMCVRPPWGQRLPLAVEMGRSQRYCK